MSMDGARASARRNAASKIKRECACGRHLVGNFAKSHLRVCEVNLAEDGWPLDEGMQSAIRQEYPGGAAAIIQSVERGLGLVYLERRRGGNKSPMRWVEFRDLVWKLAEDAAQRLT